MLKEFRDFAMKGNVLDMAVGVIIGGAFGKIVTSLVNDVLMPAIGVLLGNLDFSELVFTVGESSVKYGMFIQSIVDFLIVAFCIFFFIKQVGRFRRKPETVPAKEPEPTKSEQLLMKIRDALKRS